MKLKKNKKCKDFSVTLFTAACTGRNSIVQCIKGLNQKLAAYLLPEILGVLSSHLRFCCVSPYELPGTMRGYGNGLTVTQYVTKFHKEMVNV